MERYLLRFVLRCSSKFCETQFVLVERRWINWIYQMWMNMYFSCFGFTPNYQFTFPARALGFREREMVSEIFWLKINFRLIEFWADPTQPQIPPFLVHSHPKCKKSACLISPQLRSPPWWRPTIDVAFQGGPWAHLEYSTILLPVCCSLSLSISLNLLFENLPRSVSRCFTHRLTIPSCSNERAGTSLQRTSIRKWLSLAEKENWLDDVQQ